MIVLRFLANSWPGVRRAGHALRTKSGSLAMPAAIRRAWKIEQLRDIPLQFQGGRHPHGED